MGDVRNLELQYVAIKQAAAEMTSTIDADLKQVVEKKDDVLAPDKTIALTIDKAVISREAAEYAQSAVDVLKANGVTNPEASADAKNFSPDELKHAVDTQKNILATVAKFNVSNIVDADQESSVLQKTIRGLEADKEMDKLTPSLPTPSNKLAADNTRKI